MDQGPKYKAKATKQVEVKKYLLNFGEGKHFLEKTQKPLTTEETSDWTLNNWTLTS